MFMAGRQVRVIPVTPTWLEVATLDSYCFVQEKCKSEASKKTLYASFKVRCINNSTTTANDSVSLKN